MTTAPETTKEGFTIYRAEKAPGLMEAGCMSIEPMTDIQKDAIAKMVEAGSRHGETIKVLVNIPGFSLTYVWFKKDFPLPLHSHDADCLYYIISGSVRLGTEDLGPRDSWFIPSGVPYTYKAGPEGVEVLEIRNETAFNFVNLSKGEAFWEKAVEACATNSEEWKTAERPKVNA